MQIVSFFESDRQAHWLEALGKCDWSAGRFLHELLAAGTFFDAVGEGSRVLLLTDGDELISFCTYAKKRRYPAHNALPVDGLSLYLPRLPRPSVRRAAVRGS